MGHYENGRWVDDWDDEFIKSALNLSSAFSIIAQNMFAQLNDWNDNSGVFRKGREMKHSELIEERIELLSKI